MTLQDKELEDKMKEQNAVLFQKAIVKKFFLLFHLFHILLQGLLKLKMGSHLNNQFKSFIVDLLLMTNFTGILICKP